MITGKTGVPNYDRASNSKFIPELWSGKLVAKFYDATVAAAISSTDYEGEIKQHGDRVYIRTVPDVAITDYQRGMTLNVQRPTSTAVELVIDKAKYFAAVADDADQMQADVNMLDMWARDASERMKIVVDQDMLQNILPDVAAANKGATAGRITGDINLGVTGTPIVINKTTVLDYIVDIGTVLDEANCPETDRFLIVPSWMAGFVKKSDLKDASITGDSQSVMRNGRLGMIDRFTVYTSNLLYATGTGSTKQWNIVAGHKSGLTFAGQLTKTEKLRTETAFGDLIRGLMIYGYKVVNGALLSHGIVARSLT